MKYTKLFVVYSTAATITLALTSALIYMEKLNENRSSVEAMFEGETDREAGVQATGNPYTGTKGKAWMEGWKSIND